MNKQNGSEESQFRRGKVLHKISQLCCAKNEDRVPYCLVTVKTLKSVSNFLLHLQNRFNGKDIKQISQTETTITFLFKSFKIRFMFLLNSCSETFGKGHD